MSTLWVAIETKPTCDSPEVSRGLGGTFQLTDLSHLERHIESDQGNPTDMAVLTRFFGRPMLYANTIVCGSMISAFVVPP